MSPVSPDDADDDKTDMRWGDELARQQQAVLNRLLDWLETRERVEGWSNRFSGLRLEV